MSTPPDPSFLDPPVDKDVPMGPSATPTDPPSTFSPSAVQQQKSSVKDAPADIVEKYKKLKRRYFELEEKHKEITDELQRSSERNVRIRQERNMLLERILELEAQHQIQANGTSSSDLVGQPSSSAFPRSLLNARARTSFVANLRQAEAEGVAGEDGIGPSSSSSKPIGGSKRERDEEKRPNDAATEEAHDAHREVKRPRVSSKGKEAEEQMRASRSPSPQRGASPNTGSKKGAALSPRDGPLGDSQGDTESTLANGVNNDMDVDATTNNHADGTPIATSNGRRASKRRASNSNETEAAADGTSVRGGKTSVRRSTRKSAVAAAAAIASEALDHSSPEPGPSTPPRSTETPAAGPSSEEKAKRPSQDAVSSTPGDAPPKPEPQAVSPITSTPEPSRSDSEPAIDPNLTAATSASTSNAKASNGTTPTTSTASSTTGSASPASTTTSTPTSSSFNPYSFYLPNANSSTYAHAAYANPYLYMMAPTMTGMHPGMPPIPGMMPPMYAPGSAGPSALAPSAPQRASAEPPRPAKPKRLKAHTVTTKNFSIPMVPRDKKGNPMLPLNVGIMTVISLGEVCMREHFHTERYIFPVGYEVTRRYLSTKDPTVEVVYHCTILDGGDGPKFQIVPSDVPDKPVIAGTATGAWSNIVRQANAIRNRQHSNSVSGPDFFGLGQNTIKHLIQQLPNADKLRDYVWQNFVEGGPLGGRHAAVIPALPEEYDASMPIGAFYPTKRERETSTVPESPRTSHYPPHIMAQQRTTPQPGAGSQQPHTPLTPQAGSSQATPVARQMPLPPNGTQLVLPPTLHIQQYRPPAESGTVAVGAGGEGVPATFASIMNAYPATAGPNDPQPPATAPAPSQSQPEPEVQAQS